METRQIAQQVIDLQKTLFNSSFTTMVALQDFTQQAMAEQVSVAPWVTDDGKKSVNEMCSFTKQCRESFKKSVDEGYARLEELMNAQDSTTTN